MPSRRKKELRDSALTNTFFDQHDSGDSGGDIHLCAYCPAHAHLCASASMRVSAEDLSELKLSMLRRRLRLITGIDTETFRLRMTNLWRERLNDVSAGDLGRVGTAVRGQLEIDSPRNVLQALRHAHEHMGNVPATAADDESTRMETFDLGNLEKVAETYDELCEKHEDEKLSEIFRLVTLGEGFKAAAKNTTRSAKDRLAKKLEIPNIVIQCKTTVQLTSCLRQAQLFNVEKRFGFEEESYKALSNGDKEESPQSFGQRLNDPFQPLVSLSKPRKKKEKKTLGSLEALNQLTRNCKLAVKDMQDLKKTFSGAEEPHTELSNLKARLKYADTPVPKDLPVHVRQWFSDAETAYLEILSLQKEAYKQLLYVKSAFVAWSSASLEVWYVHLKALFPFSSTVRGARSLLLHEAHSTLIYPKSIPLV